MATRDQERAARIFEQVTKVQEGQRRKYGALSHKLPVLVHGAGLAQALEFVNARGGESGQGLLDDLAKAVGFNSGNELRTKSRTADLSDYMWLTRDVLAALLWYKRFAQSVLGIDVSEGADDEQPPE